MAVMGRWNRRKFMKYSLKWGRSAPQYESRQASSVPRKRQREEKDTQNHIYAFEPSDFLELGGTLSLPSKSRFGGRIETLGWGLSGQDDCQTQRRHATSAGGSMDRIDPPIIWTEFTIQKHAVKGGRNYQHYRNPNTDKVCDDRT